MHLACPLRAAMYKGVAPELEALLTSAFNEAST